MKIKPVDFDVSAGTGAANETGTLIPIVRVVVKPEGAEPITAYLTPITARRIGLDLLATATMAWADTGMRMWARDHGQDGDGLIGSVKALVDIALEDEEPRPKAGE